MNIEIIPLITGLVAVVKQAGLPSRYAPIFAIVLGIVLNLSHGTNVAEVVQSVATGVFYGLSAVGLWEAGKLPSKFVDSE